MELPKEIRRMALQALEEERLYGTRKKEYLEQKRDEILKCIKVYKEEKTQYLEISNRNNEVREWVERMGYSVEDLKKEIYNK